MTVLMAAALGATAGWGILVALAGCARARRRSLRDRVAPHVARVSPAAFTAACERRDGVSFRIAGVRRMGRLGERYGAVARASAKLASVLSVIASRKTPSSYLLSVAGIGSLGLTLGLMWGIVTVVGGAPLAAIPAMAIGGLLLGVAGPLLGLERNYRQARARVVEELPVLLGLVVLALRAGESLPRSLQRAAFQGRGRLAREFGVAVESIDLGGRLENALTSLARRWDVPEVSLTIDSMVNAMATGAPVADVLAIRVEELIAQRTQRALERASKQEVGMLIPLVFLILPVTIIFAVLPGLLALNAGLW